jgi:hypothetical protein
MATSCPVGDHKPLTVVPRSPFASRTVPIFAETLSNPNPISERAVHSKRHIICSTRRTGWAPLRQSSTSILD